MSALRAPVAVPVEIRIGVGADARRVFRLCGERRRGRRAARARRAVRGRAASSPCASRCPRRLDAGTLALRAEVLHADHDDELRNEEAGGRELTFIEPSAEARAAIRAYVRDRLSLHE